MKTLQTLILSALALASLPALASDESRSADACAQALARQVSGGAGVTRPYRVDYLRGTSGSLLAAFYAVRFTFDMQARDRQGAPIARATCVTDRAGHVKSLELSPAGGDARVAAAF